MFMNDNNNSNSQATAPVVAPVSTKMSDEEKAKREAARQANLEVIKPFIPQGIEAVAASMGVDSATIAKLYELGIKEVMGKVHAEARKLNEEVNGKPKAVRTAGAPTPKWIGKTVDQLRRTLGFAENHNINSEIFGECLKKALELGAIKAEPKVPAAE